MNALLKSSTTLTVKRHVIPYHRVPTIPFILDSVHPSSQARYDLFQRAFPTQTVRWMRCRRLTAMTAVCTTLALIPERLITQPALSPQTLTDPRLSVPLTLQLTLPLSTRMHSATRHSASLSNSSRVSWSWRLRRVCLLCPVHDRTTCPGRAL